MQKFTLCRKMMTMTKRPLQQVFFHTQQSLKLAIHKEPRKEESQKRI